MWPDRTVVLSQLGRRFETFANELRRARNHARVAGLLAHGVTAPEVFEGALLAGDAPRPVELQLYETHLTVVPAEGDPFQIPIGSITDAQIADDPPRVIVEADGAGAEIGRLARNRDAFFNAVKKRIAAQSQLLADLTGHDVFCDGRGIVRSLIRGFDQLIARVATPERHECARTLLARCTGEPRVGFVQLLDPDDDGGGGGAAGLPNDWASFLIVPVGNRTVVELLAGPAAATYIFAALPETVNRDMQLLHFRRAPLALTAEQAEVTPVNPYRLALRRLQPLQRLRSSMSSRLIHNEAWADALARALE